MTFTIRVHAEADGTYWCDVAELPGCFASGHTWDDLWEALTDAIGLYLSSDTERVTVEMHSPEPIKIRATQHRVAVC